MGNFLTFSYRHCTQDIECDRMLSKLLNSRANSFLPDKALSRKLTTVTAELQVVENYSLDKPGN